MVQGKHAELIVRHPARSHNGITKTQRAIGFNMWDKKELLESGYGLHIAYTLEEDGYSGRQAPLLKLKDVLSD